MNISDFINLKYRYAVIGATQSAEKYGYKVIKDLHNGEFNVVGINPHYVKIEGIPVYKNLSDVPEKPDVAVVVVPSRAGLKILDEAKKTGIKKIWFQPGAESGEIIEKAKQLGLDIVADGSCIMTARRNISFDQ